MALCGAGIVSCGTTASKEDNTARQKIKFEILYPVDIVGKLLVGSDEKSEYGLMLFTDGHFLYKINDLICEGMWTFDGTAPLYRYRFDWMEDGKPQGYAVDFGKNGQLIVWIGHWYLTGEYRSFFKKMVVLEREIP
jgi:hypothetical protein